MGEKLILIISVCRKCLIGLIFISITNTSFAQFILSGNAVQTSSSCYRLTVSSAGQAGSIFYMHKLDLTQSFQLDYLQDFGNRQGAALGADGIAFVMQDSCTAVGSTGGGIGYSGIVPSVVVEFDDFPNTGGGTPYSDPANNHVGLVVNGNPDHSAPTSRALHIFPGNNGWRYLTSNNPHPTTIIWDAVTFNLQVIIDGITVVNYTEDFNSTVFNNKNYVYWGFTASTGSSYNQQSVCIVNYPTSTTQLSDTSICAGTVIPVQTNNSMNIYQWTTTNGTDSTISDQTIFNPILAPSITTTYIVTMSDDCATIQDSITITVLDPISIFTSTTVASCGTNNGSATVDSITGGAVPYQYLWTDSLNQTVGNTPSVGGLIAGFYYVTITDTYGCSNSLPVLVSASGPINISVNVINANCGGSDGVASVDTTLLTGTPPFSYLWDDLLGQTTPVATGLPAGVYTVIVTDALGCTGTLTVSVTTSDNLIPVISGSVLFCNGQSTTLDAGSNFTNYLWSNNSTSQAIQVTQPGLYSVIVTDLMGCTGSASVLVSVYPSNIPAITGNFNFCQGDSTFLDADSGFVNYIWSNGSTLPSIPVFNGGVYSVTVTDSNGCTTDASASVNEIVVENAIAGEDQIICASSTSLDALQPVFGSGSWTVIQGTASFIDQNSSTSSVSDLSSGLNIFLWTVSNGICFSLDTLEILVIENDGCDTAIFIPNIFTPNNDGYNDLFEVKGLLNFPDNRLEVYNRWGELVYFKDSYTNTWDGTGRNENPLPDGTYFVILKVTKLSRVFKGSLNIYR